MQTVALVVAAGRGTRAGGACPKQYGDLCGKPVLTRTLQAILSAPIVDACLTVIAEADRAAYEDAVAGIDDARLLAPVIGDVDRQGSVRNGLVALEEHAPEIVLIHDAARPFVSVDVIDRVTEAARRSGAALAALPLVDTVWREDAGKADACVPRTGLWRAQTPQGFRYDMIRAAHEAAVEGGATDDVSLARAAGHAVTLVEGEGDNFKITLPGDFDRARRLLGG